MRPWAPLLALLLAPLHPAAAAPLLPSPRQTLSTPVPPHDARNQLFYDHFAGPFDAGPTPAHCWMTCLPYGGQCVRTQAWVPEAQCYTDATTKTDPFSTPARIPGVTGEPSLVIAADHTAPGGNPCGTPYTSGIVTTFGSFAFQYGYVEARIKAPGGAATWPGFWLLPVDNRGAAEIDILEIFGYDPAHMQATVIAQNRKPFFADYTIIPLPDPGGWHTYGLDWGPETTTWFLDGAPVKQVRTPPEAKVPMYVLLNLALYGEGSTNMAKEHALPAPPPPPQFPARMVVSYVGVWRTPATAGR